MILALACIALHEKPVVSGVQPAAAGELPTIVLAQPGRELFPSSAPDGALAFSWMDGDDWDVYVRRTSGNLANLTADSPSDDWQAEYSPDGRWLAFRSERDDGGIYLMPAGGGEATRVTREGFNPTWSPDGSEIIYSTAQIIASPASRPLRGTLRGVKVLTGERRTIYAGDAVQPRWSPNGHRIAFWAFAAHGGQRDIWTIGGYGHAGVPIGGQPVPVTQDAATDWNPVWSPDGRYLYFASDRSGAGEIWRVRIDELTGQVQGAHEQLTSGGRGVRAHMTFSDKGTRLLFIDETLNQTVERIGFDAATGRTVGSLTPVLGGDLAPAGLDVSADGQSLVFYSAAPQEDLYVSRSDGTNRRRLTDDPARDRGPAWSPDGRQIAFFSDRSGSYEIWTINADGTGLRQLTNTPGANRSGILWSPDGSRLLYQQRRESTWDVYLIDPRKPPEQQVLEQLPAIGRSDEYFSATSWSRDGQHIAGNRAFLDRASPAGIFVYSLAAKTFRMVTDAAAGGRWLSDGRRLIYPDAARKRIFLADTASQERREVLSVVPRDLGAIRLTADDRMLYVQLSVTPSNIWAIRLSPGP
jgi:Tol biopolymer transport system component